MDRAALTIALVAIAISIVGLIWQLALYRLSGARIRVELTLAVMTHRGTILKGSRGRWPKRLPDEPEVHEGDLWAELAQISVANIGRTVVWASEIGLDFGSEARLKRRRRLTLSLRPIGVGGGLTGNAPVRLEPGQSVFMFVPIVQSMSWAQGHRRHRRLTVRGTATLAGRRAKRSPWRRACRVRKEQSIRFPHGELTRAVVVYQELLNDWPSSDVGKLYEAWFDVWVVLKDAPESANLAEALTPYFESLVGRIQLANRLREAFRSAPVVSVAASSERLAMPVDSEGDSD